MNISTDTLTAEQELDCVALHDLERRVVGSILAAPADHADLMDLLNPWRLFGDPRHAFLVAGACAVSKHGAALGAGEMAVQLYRGCPITLAAAQQLVARLMLESCDDLDEGIRVLLTCAECRLLS